MINTTSLANHLTYTLLLSTQKLLKTLKNNWLPPVGLAVLIAVQSMGLIPLQHELRSYLFDTYQKINPREKTSSPVIIVDIDEASLKQFGQWPWPRSLVAQLLDRISTMQPAATALDIILPEADRSSPCNIAKLMPNIDSTLIRKICALPSNDTLLATALSNGTFALGVAGIDNSTKQLSDTPLKSAPMLVVGADPLHHMRAFQSTLNNIEELTSAATGNAILSADIEDGVVRKIPLVANIKGTVLPTLSVEILRLALNSPTFKVHANEQGITGVGVKDLIIPTQRNGSLWVHYSPHDPTRFISAADLFKDDFDPQHIQQKLVLLGFSGLGLVDFPTTAIGERVPGVEIHAQVLESIFDGTTLLRPYWVENLEILLILLSGIIVFYLIPNIRATVQLPIFIATIFSLFALGLYLYSKNNWLIDVGSPIVFFVLLSTLSLLDRMIKEEGQIKTLEHDLRIQREEAARFQGEMSAAKRFQLGIVPNAAIVFANENRLDISATMEPAKMVGGDLYDCFMLDEDNVFFIVGDVCGKGVPASLFMVISKTLCKSIILRKGALNEDLGTLVTQANLEISRDNPEMLFVTAFVGILNLSNGKLTYCNAGHDRPISLAPNCKPIELTNSSGPPISILDEHEYKTFQYQLASEEFLCLFSDGVSEACNAKEEFFGQERLLGCLSEINKETTSQDILDTTLKSVKTFVNGADPSDDLTIMVIRWKQQKL
jgi:adenylate cyclase